MVNRHSLCERQIAASGYLSPGSFTSIHERKCEFLVDLLQLPPFW